MTDALAIPVDWTPSPREVRPLLRGAAVGLVAVLVLLLTQGWAPQLVNDEPSRVAPSTPPGQPDIDAASVVEQATHRVIAAPGLPGTLEVRDEGYVSRFDASGFTYAPTGATTPFGVTLSSVERGGSAIALDTGVWTGTTNVVERPMGPGMTERVTARDGEVEWDVVLAAAPAGTGDLVVGARLDGLAGAPERISTSDGPAWRLSLEGGHAVVVDEVVVRDALGTELHRALPTIAGGRITLDVPDAVLTGAAYPLVVDPTVGVARPVSSQGTRGFPSVGFDGANFLVVWQQPEGATTEIFGALVSGDNNTSGTPFRISAAGGVSAHGADVAWNGSEFLVVWEEQLAPANADIRGQRVSTAGGLSGGEVNISSPTSVQRAPAVSAAGSTWFVVWHDCRNTSCDIFGGRVTSTGAVLDGTGVPISTDAKNEFIPDIAYNGTRFLVAWEHQFSGSDDDIFAALVTTGGSSTGGFIVANPFGRQRDPAVASDGSGWLVAYEDDRSGVNDVYGSRINSSGVVQESFVGFPISTLGDSQSDAAVAFNGTYLVAWRDRRDGSDPDIFATRVATDGTVQDSPNAGFVINNSGLEEDAPAVARAPGSGKWAVDYEFGGAGATTITQRIASK